MVKSLTTHALIYIQYHRQREMANIVMLCMLMHDKI